MGRRFFLDFDGTLVDPRRRLYQLFCELAPEYKGDFEEYWQGKRSNMRQEQLLQQLHYTKSKIMAFKIAWMEQVEAPERLALDEPLAGVLSFLVSASQQAELYLVSGRQHRESLQAQMQKFGFLQYFSGIFNTAQHVSKSELIRQHLTWDSQDILVGDSAEDILAGKALGMRTVAVSSGMSSAEILRRYHPDVLLESVIDMCAFL